VLYVSPELTYNTLRSSASVPSRILTTVTTVFVVLAWVLSLCLHEFSHACVAYFGGDTTVKDKGYLTFNPLKYAHPMLTIVYPLVFLLMGGIGLPGGAVYIDRSRLRSRGWDSATSLAGPGANLVLALLLAIPFMLGVRPSDEGWFWPAYGFVLVLQVSSVLLNLIPIPPLDGYGAIAPWLPRGLRETLERRSDTGLWIVFLALWFVRPLNEAFWKAVYGISETLGVSPILALEGYRAFKFW
jgi:Zn-dependent protease